jgi:hypothetical protein
MNGATTFGSLVPVSICLLALGCGSSDPNPSPTPSAANSSSPQDVSCGAIDQVPFANELIIPADLPKGLRLGNACWSESSRSQSADLFYGTEDGTGKLLISIYSGDRAAALRLEGLPTIDLGATVGQVSDEPQSGGGAFYFIQFEKDARLYTVAQNVGVNNAITREDIDAVALSIAEK